MDFRRQAPAQTIRMKAVGLVGDDDDVAPVRKHGVAVAGLGGHELPDGREDDATTADTELLAQVGAVGGLDGILRAPLR